MKRKVFTLVCGIFCLAVQSFATTNVALTGTATQSSTRSGYLASYAIDDNTTNYSHTNNDGSEWWELDLGGSYDLSYLVVYNRAGYLDRLIGAEILVLDASRNPVGYYMFTTADASYTIDNYGASFNNARYIRINQNVNYLTLGEVQAWTVSTAVYEVGNFINVAPNGAATKSSGYPMYPSSYAIDNSTATFSHTNNGGNEWWQLYLESSYDIDQIVVHGQTSFPERLVNATLKVLDSQQNQIGITYTFLIADPVHTIDNGGMGFANARYILIEQATNYLVLCEVQVFIPLARHQSIPADGAKYIHPYSHNNYGDVVADNSASDWSGVELLWGEGVGDPNYNVYFGSDFNDVNSASNPDVLPGRGNHLDTRYHCGQLLDNTTYHWRVDEVSSSGIVKGPMWSFTTNLPAFPGAEGFGRYAIGGRGGVVIKVTNLNDSGPGSLREAVEAEGPRIVVFEVSGNISLSTRLTVNNPYITIAGQTAPGDGICLKGPLTINAHDVVVRYIRARPDDTLFPNVDAINDGWSPESVHDFILDHCSASWGTDETITIGYSPNVTVQWCISSEALLDHSMAMVCGGPYGSFHHNLLAHSNSRNPLYAGVPAKVIDFRNNVIYNWGGMSSYGGEKSMVNHVNNFYKYGPATSTGVRYLIFKADVIFTKMYCNGNYVTGSSTITSDNWNGGIMYGGDTSESTLRLYSPLDVSAAPVTTQSAEDAYDSVLADVGATLPSRDSLDARILQEVTDGDYTYGTNGIISAVSDTAGWPTLNSTTPPTDTDNDGIPNEWELCRGLNPNDPEDGSADPDGDGYTNIEDYLNYLTENLKGDFKPDGHVDFTDFAILGLSWQAEPGDSNWNVNCDISDPADDVIDNFDLEVFSDNWLLE